MSKQDGSSTFVPQRWERPLDVPPGFWKQQLAGKYLNIARKGDLSALSQLLQENPEFLNKRGSHNRTLLWEATRNGRMEAVRWLVERGADVDATGCYNSETLVQVTPYCAAIYYKRPAIADYLRPRTAPADIFRAAFLGDQSRVASELTDHPELLNAEDPHDPIYYVPVIAFAVAGGQAEMTESLLQRGAVVAPYSGLLIHLAGLASRMDVLELLVAHGVDVCAMDSGSFIVMSDLQIMRYLLRQGASPARLGKNGVLPLLYLVRGDKREDPDKVALLLEHGAPVNAVDAKGRTALHLAAAAGHLRVLTVLLEHGANTALQDEQGETALSLARAAGKAEAEAMLRQHV